MPELGPYGSVRGARSNARPYRDQQWIFARDGLSAYDPTTTLRKQTAEAPISQWQLVV
jgi:hypothetical protein